LAISNTPEVHKRRLRFGDQQHSGGLPVQTMHYPRTQNIFAHAADFRILGDNPVRDGLPVRMAGRVHLHVTWFIDGHQDLILVQNRNVHIRIRLQLGRDSRKIFRKNFYLIVKIHLVVGLYFFATEANPPGSDQTCHATPRKIILRNFFLQQIKDRHIQPLVHQPPRNFEHQFLINFLHTSFISPAKSRIGEKDKFWGIIENNPFL